MTISGNDDKDGIVIRYCYQRPERARAREYINNDATNKTRIAPLERDTELSAAPVAAAIGRGPQRRRTCALAAHV